MNRPLPRPTPYNRTLRYGGKPKIPSPRVAHIEERIIPRPINRSNNVRVDRNSKISAGRQVRRPVQIPKKKPVSNVPVLVRPSTPRAAVNATRNIKGKIVRQAQSEALIRSHGNKIRELKDKGRGRILVMVACGPSINEIDLTVLKNNSKIDIMSINKPDKRVWPTTYWAFCDLSQYNRNKELWDAYKGTVINSSSIRVAHPNQVLIRTRSGQGFSKDITSGYFIGRSTTYANMQTALYMGYDRIYIFGCDMGAVNGQLHFYGKNPDVDDRNREQRFAREAEHYQFAADTLSESERKKFYFCSSYNNWPFVKSFNKRDQKDAIIEILNIVNEKI